MSCSTDFETMLEQLSHRIKEKQRESSNLIFINKMVTERIEQDLIFIKKMVIERIEQEKFMTSIWEDCQKLKSVRKQEESKRKYKS
ncbi:hypothetical protein VIGAN_04181100 [Vigna angularis var. angularis]|uniref:Uncharacterized protein n=1 Tax=Vigna angularis var. angularis TaxID=157739 RepID=A0A0S3RV24_PHAAN|nr:hypothetical protein VIGAN_04181100 [Vigna angularis var. angularis]